MTRRQVDSLRLHFLRNVLAAVPKGHAEMVAAIRTIFAQPSPVHVRDQLEVIAAMLGRQFPKVETMLREASDDITAFASFPVRRPLEEDLVHQPAGTAEQGNQAPHRRRRRVP